MVVGECRVECTMKSIQYMALFFAVLGILQAARCDRKDTDANLAMCIKRTRDDFASGGSTLNTHRDVYAAAFERCTRTATAF
jgi:hypothetical protein